MENATIEAITKQVGNSIAIFIPAEIRDELGLGPNEKVVASIHKKKKKDKQEILAVFGALKGTKMAWSCREDRLHEWRE